MVSIGVLLPSPSDIAALATLRGKLQALGINGQNGTLDAVRLTASQRPPCDLWVEWKSVVFKFEIFGLKIGQSVASGEWGQLAEVGENFRVAGLFRFEWERQAAPGEVRPDWEPIVAGRGRRGAIPPSSSAGGVSMVGLDVYCPEPRDRFVVLTSDAVPGALRMLRDRRAIEAEVQSCESVPLVDVEKYQSELMQWMRSKFGSPEGG
jgi:hypothetical protein